MVAEQAEFQVVEERRKLKFVPQETDSSKTHTTWKKNDGREYEPYLKPKPKTREGLQDWTRYVVNPSLRYFLVASYNMLASNRHRWPMYITDFPYRDLHFLFGDYHLNNPHEAAIESVRDSIIVSASVKGKPIDFYGALAIVGITWAATCTHQRLERDYQRKVTLGLLEEWDLPEFRYRLKSYASLFYSALGNNPLREVINTDLINTEKPILYTTVSAEPYRMKSAPNLGTKKPERRRNILHFPEYYKYLRSWNIEEVESLVNMLRPLAKKGVIGKNRIFVGLKASDNKALEAMAVIRAMYDGLKSGNGNNRVLDYFRYPSSNPLPKDAEGVIKNANVTIKVMRLLGYDLEATLAVLVSNYQTNIGGRASFI